MSNPYRALRFCVYSLMDDECERGCRPPLTIPEGERLERITRELQTRRAQCHQRFRETGRDAGEVERRINNVVSAVADAGNAGDVLQLVRIRLRFDGGAAVELEALACEFDGGAAPTTGTSASEGRGAAIEAADIVPSLRRESEGGQLLTNNESDGPFDADGFRFDGVEVRFGRSALQPLLVLALWDATIKQISPPRPVDDVMAEVYGHDHDTSDNTFRQLCADTRRRFEAANFPLGITTTGGRVHLARL